jgi:hypothetical protein
MLPFWQVGSFVLSSCVLIVAANPPPDNPDFISIHPPRGESKDEAIKVSPTHTEKGTWSGTCRERSSAARVFRYSAQPLFTLAMASFGASRVAFDLVLSSMRRPANSCETLT